MGEVVPIQQHYVHPALARIESLENRLHGVVEKLVAQGEAEDMSSKDRSRVIVTTLAYLNYARQLNKFNPSDQQVNEDDLIAMPTQEIEKILAYSIRMLGSENVKKLIAQQG